MLVGETSLFIAGDGNQDSSRGVQMGNRISVRPGDVVGYYQDTVGQQGISMQGEGVQLDNSVTDVQVWYHTETVEEPLVVGPSRCVHRVGQEGQLRLSTQAAPAITVEICKCMTYRYRNEFFFGGNLCLIIIFWQDTMNGVCVGESNIPLILPVTSQILAAVISIANETANTTNRHMEHYQAITTQQISHYLLL